MVIALDGHKLGHIAGALVAFTVLSISFLLHNADALATFTRVGWSFVIAYGATYFLVRVILRTTLALLALEKQTALREKRERHREQRTRGQAQETPEAIAEPATLPEEEEE